MEKVIYRGEMYFSYGQFLAFEASVTTPGCEWTATHYDQGFARRAHTVSFATLLEFGHASLSVHLGAYQLEIVSGDLVIVGPEEFELQRIVPLATGHYSVVAAQATLGDDRETIDVYLQKLSSPSALIASRILIADHDLRPPPVLLETSELAIGWRTDGDE